MKVTTYPSRARVAPRGYANRQEALARAARVAEQLNSYKISHPRIKEGDKQFSLDRTNGVRTSGIHHGDSGPELITTSGLSRLIAIGETRVRTLEKAINKELLAFPEIVAAARLDGSAKPGELTELLKSIAVKKVEDLGKILKDIDLPERTTMHLTTHPIDGVDASYFRDTEDGRDIFNVNIGTVSEQLKFLQNFAKIEEKIKIMRGKFV